MSLRRIAVASAYLCLAAGLRQGGKWVVRPRWERLTPMGGMTDVGRGVARRIFTPVASVLLRLHVSPDAITIVGTLGVAVSALVFFPQGRFFLGTLVICLFVFSDALDGTMARLAGRSSHWGAFLDSSLDRIADAAVFVGIVLWFAGDGDDLLMAAVVLAGLVGGFMVSYVRARAEALGAKADVGVAERTERLVLILAATGLSGLFDLPVLLTIGAWAVAILAWVTFLQRMYVVRAQLLHGRS